MIKLHLLLLVSATLVMSLCAHAQDRTLEDEAQSTVVDKLVSEEPSADANEESNGELIEVPPPPTEDSLWQDAKANMSIESMNAYLAKFPNGKYTSDAESKLKALKKIARARAKDDKELEAYRKQKTVNGLLLELDGEFGEVKPYIRSMLNSCGYALVQPHRFAKRVYPALEIGGRIFNGQSNEEYSVTLDLSLTLKSNTREIKAREKMRSYRESNVDTHQALIAGFEDVGSQMASKGFCVN